MNIVEYYIRDVKRIFEIKARLPYRKRCLFFVIDEHLNVNYKIVLFQRIDDFVGIRTDYNEPCLVDM